MRDYRDAKAMAHTLREALAAKADLIVMTSHRPVMRTYFLGSNAGHVVRYAKCSVLVVRH
jgi:nucleotide-binding universal stress UspA family protein